MKKSLSCFTFLFVLSFHPRAAKTSIHIRQGVGEESVPLREPQLCCLAPRLESLHLTAWTRRGLRRLRQDFNSKCEPEYSHGMGGEDRGYDKDMISCFPSWGRGWRNHKYRKVLLHVCLLSYRGSPLAPSLKVWNILDMTLAAKWIQQWKEMQNVFAFYLYKTIENTKCSSYSFMSAGFKIVQIIMRQLSGSWWPKLSNDDLICLSTMTRWLGLMMFVCLRVWVSVQARRSCVRGKGERPWCGLVSAALRGKEITTMFIFFLLDSWSHGSKWELRKLRGIGEKKKKLTSILKTCFVPELSICVSTDSFFWLDWLLFFLLEYSSSQCS